MKSFDPKRSLLETGDLEHPLDALIQNMEFVHDRPFRVIVAAIPALKAEASVQQFVEVQRELVRIEGAA